MDTSVWIDHLRQGDGALAGLLEGGQVAIHPLVLGELAMGSLTQRDLVLGALQSLQRVEIAREEEVLQFVEQGRLFGLGIGYIDAHLLAATQLTPEAVLWTRDRRLAGVAGRLGLAYAPAG